ncbi:MAG: sulfatase-like hydrolase/transferase [Cytophagaceae bacterium]|nr:sulfatase-like hydrolase/transferase [Gemmatimonadaceae bacterium]
MPPLFTMLLRTRPAGTATPPPSVWRDRACVALYAAAIALPGLVGLLIKRKLLVDEGGGFDLVAWALGLTDGSQLPTLQRIALFRWDVVVMFVILPLAWLAFVRLMGPRVRLAVTIIVAFLASAALFIELKCFWEVGTFLPLHVLMAGAVGAGRKFAGEYVQSGSLIKLAVLMGGIVIASYLAFAMERAPRGRLRGVPGWKASLGVLAASIAIAMLPLVPRTPFSRSAAMLALTEFTGQGQIPNYTNQPLTAAELLHQYRGVSNAPVPNAPSPYFGKAKGFNVLVYLFETLPYACLNDAATSPDPFPNLRSLENSSFIADRHYATYPYSRRAYFSIFSGWYPPHGMRDYTDETWENVSALGSPGMVRSARAAGYETVAYVPEHPDTWEADLVRYRVLGFNRHVVPANAGAVTPELRMAPKTRRGWQRPQDDSARAMLKRDIVNLSAEGTPWFVSFNPQVSHGPWTDAASITSNADACARGADAMGEVDRGLGDILSVLDSIKQRDRTLIVVMGDHGLRNRVEFPLFRGATLDDITFHVPVFISAPTVLREGVKIPWVTSHIDIAPSVLDLLGIAEGRELEQGSPMWNPALTDRRVFIFAQGYLGVDGYVEGDRAVMMNYMYKGVSESRGPRLEFSPRQLMQTPDSTSRAVTSVLWEVNKIQNAFMQYLPTLSTALTEARQREAGGEVRLTPTPRAVRPPGG